MLILILGSILPPGFWITTFAPSNAIVISGHFLTFDTLHLMEFAKIAETTLYMPNLSVIKHPAPSSITRTLCRMVMCLGKCISCRNFSFLCTTYTHLFTDVHIDSLAALYLMDRETYMFDTPSSRLLKYGPEKKIQKGEVTFALKHIAEYIPNVTVQAIREFSSGGAMDDKVKWVRSNLHHF